MPEQDELEARNLELVRLHYAAFSSGDVTAIMDDLDPGVEIVVHDEHGSAEEERIQGQDEARAFFEGIKAAVTDNTVEVEAIRADRDRVLATIRLGGTSRETGAAGSIEAVHLFTCHEGLITSIRTHRPDWRRLAGER